MTEASAADGHPAGIGASTPRGHARPGIRVSLPYIGWLGVAVAIGLLIGLPIAALAGALLGAGPDALARGAGATASIAILDSLSTSTVATLVAVSGGLAAALLTERSGAPGRRWLRAGLLVPLVTPALVASIGWVDAYAPSGLLDQVAGIGVPALFGPFGVVAVMSAGSLPIAYLVIASALAARAEPDLERAARASGATAWEAFRTITLPLLRPSLGAAAVLVFVLSMNAFDAPAVLGLPAGFGTMTTRIYGDLVLSADPAAFERVLALASVLVVLAGTMAAVADSVGTGATIVRTGGPAGAPGGRRSGVAVAGAIAAWLWITLTAILPLVALVLTALTRAVGLPPVPANWTLANFAAALDGAAVPALLHTVALAVLAAAVVLVLGTLVVALPGRRPRRIAGGGVTVGFALPGSTLAVAVLLAYGGWLRDSVALILVAYVAKFWVLGYRPLAAAAGRLPADLVRAARASGAGPSTVARTILAPLLLPALGVGASLVMLFALHELTMSSLLYGPGSETLAVYVLDLQQLGDPTVTAALAVLLALLVVLAGAPVALFWRLRRSGGVAT